jgi:hypothetical protein
MDDGHDHVQPLLISRFEKDTPHNSAGRHLRNLATYTIFLAGMTAGAGIAALVLWETKPWSSTPTPSPAPCAAGDGVAPSARPVWPAKFSYKAVSTFPSLFGATDEHTYLISIDTSTEGAYKYYQVRFSKRLNSFEYIHITHDLS